MEKKTIYLHVGTTKTGTTTLQTLLRENEDVLRRKNFTAYTPCRPKDESDPKRMRSLIEYMNLLSSNLTASRRLNSWFDQFMNGVKQESAARLILSEELLWNVIGSVRKRWNFKRFLQELQTFVDVKVLVYLRRQDNYLMSCYQQRLKSGLMNGLTCREWVHSGRMRLQADYKRRLKWLLPLVGRENLMVRVFEPEQLFHGTLEADFLHALGMELSDGFSDPRRRRNPGLSPFLAELFRCASFFQTDEKIFKPFLKLRLSADDRYFNKNRTHQFLSPKERCRLMKKYKSGNGWIAREFFGRKDGILFREPLPPADSQWCEYRLSEEDVRSFFADLEYPDPDQKDRICEQVLSVIQNKIRCRERWGAKRMLWTKIVRRKIRELSGLSSNVL